MSLHEPKHWLLCYDICHPRRLARIHRYLCKCAWPLQYSMFGLERSEAGIRRILDDLALLIDPEVDDIRCYHIPDHSPVWTYGVQALPEGILLPATGIFRFLQQPMDPSALPQLDLFPSPLASHRQIKEIRSLRFEPPPRSRGD